MACQTLHLSKMNLEVNFNPAYSMGTSAIRGSKPMASGRHHYWEVKMISQVYGTDVVSSKNLHRIFIYLQIIYKPSNTRGNN